ncbi:hypothetical protein, partial, partial [Absidia glauca]
MIPPYCEKVNYRVPKTATQVMNLAMKHQGLNYHKTEGPMYKRNWEDSNPTRKRPRTHLKSASIIPIKATMTPRVAGQILKMHIFDPHAGEPPDKRTMIWYEYSRYSKLSQKMTLSTPTYDTSVK